MEFRSDGTYDAVKVTTLPMRPILGPAAGLPLETKETVSGLYRWLDDEHIEITLPKSEGGEKVRLRVIIRGDDLTMVCEDGEVTRGKWQR